jgi:hypothetical protein
MSQRQFVRATLAGVCVVPFLGLGIAQSAPLGPAVVAGQVAFSNPPSGIQVGTFGTFPLSGPNGSLQFTAAGTPSPFLSADAVMAPFFFGRASGTLLYEMQVLGPAGEVPVLIAVSGSVAGTSSLSSGDDFAGFAMKSTWSFETISAVPVIPEQGITTPSLTGVFSQSFGETHALMLTANQVYRVRMTADAGARAATAMAFIDPIFSFGAGVGPEYSFEFSEGIANVPEPASIALWGAGLVFIGLCRARPRRPGRRLKASACA